MVWRRVLGTASTHKLTARGGVPGGVGPGLRCGARLARLVRPHNAKTPGLSAPGLWKGLALLPLAGAAREAVGQLGENCPGIAPFAQVAVFFGADPDAGYELVAVELQFQTVVRVICRYSSIRWFIRTSPTG